MANKPKQIGTAHETRFARAADERPALRAKRAENNAPGRDVDVTLRDGSVWPHECKHRANLNVHKLAAEVAAKQPTTPPIIVWKRSSRKGDNTNRTQDGPPMVAVTEEFWLDVLGVLSDVAYEAPHWMHEITSKYPGLATEVG